MEIAAKTIDDVTVFEIAGDVDGKTAPTVRERVVNEVEKGGNAILDMTQVAYMSSAGLRVLLTIYHHTTQQQGGLVLAGVIEEVKETMEMTGFLEYFTFSDTAEEAIRIIHSEKADH